MKEVKTKIGFAIISLLLSILIGTILPSLVEYFSNGKVKILLGEQILIGICSFIAISFVEFLYFYNQSLQYIKKEYPLWELANKGDNLLYNIRTNFHKVIQDAKTDNDIFVLYFEKEFKKLQRKISEVAEKKELFIAADYFLNAENLLKIFPTYDESVWRYVWKIENVEHCLFKEHSWRQFFEKTAKMVAQKKMKEIKTIIVLNDQSFIESTRIKKLLGFFKTNDGIDCRLISMESYATVCRLNSFETSLSDFGLYGHQLLFIEKYQEGEVTGSFSKDITQINDYSRLFDGFWEATTITDENPSKEISKIDVDTLIKFDLNYKCEDGKN